MDCSNNYLTVWLQLHDKRFKTYLKVTIEYFSWVRVKIQKSHESFEFSDEMTFSKLKNELINQNSFFDEIFKDSSIKFFLNLKEITDENISINDGDEIALLPPVTGG